MQKKRNPDRSRGQNLISVFARLFFSGRPYSLIELAGYLDCSKQTVIALIRELETLDWMEIDSFMKGGRRFYQVRRARLPKVRVALTDEELDTLIMCRAFTGHLLGRDQFDAAMSALHKSQQLLHDSPESGDDSADHDARIYGVYRPGAIDYTPFRAQWQTLLEAMEKSLVCEISYQKILEKKPKTSRIKPLKIFSHRETVYVHARYAKEPGKLFKAAPYDPLLALHRFRSVKLTDTPFVRPADYDFEKTFNAHFGVIKQKRFQVKAELTGWAAGFTAERKLSPDQKIVRRRGGKLLITFSATSAPE
ncbi:WYL domain-containing protein, partial [bacterium]|nr:WYL domain-containing protein [bacterium]